jgi:hypothetical protein
MKPAHKTMVVIAFVILVVLLLMSGSGMTTGATIGGVMAGGNMGEIGWTWLPSLLFVVVGVVLFAVTVSRK